MHQKVERKVQKPKKSTLHIASSLQRKTVNQTGFGTPTVDTQSLVEKHNDTRVNPGMGSHSNYDFSKIPITLNSSPSIQTKLKIGQPDDKYEREADRVAEQVMQMPEPRQYTFEGNSSLANNINSRSGTVQRVCASCSEQNNTVENENRPSSEDELLQAKQITPIIQRQESFAEEQKPENEPVEQEQVPAPGDEAVKSGGGSGSGSSSTLQTSNCIPKGVTRAVFLTKPGATTKDLGSTVLSSSVVTFPEAITQKSGGRYRLQPTTAGLGAIPSFFTIGSFVEGEVIFAKHNEDDCPSGKYPLHWFIGGEGAKKLKEGEQEHCNDFSYAFDISLKLYAAEVNRLANKKTSFRSKKSAENALKKSLGVAPADWRSTFHCLAKKSLTRDTNNSHKPRPRITPPHWRSDCKEARAFITKNSLKRLGADSSLIIKGCGEPKNVQPANKPASSPSGTKSEGAEGANDLQSPNAEQITSNEETMSNVEEKTE